MAKNESNNIPKTGIKIIGFGNIYMSDDAVGLRVIEKLKGKLKGIEIIDGGTSAADLIILAKNSSKIIVIDAVDAGQDIGQIVRFTTKEISKYIGNLKSYSLHDFNLQKALELIQNLKIKTEIIIIGIRPKKVEFGEALSPEINEKIPEIVEMAVREIND